MSPQRNPKRSAGDQRLRKKQVHPEPDENSNPRNVNKSIADRDPAHRRKDSRLEQRAPLRPTQPPVSDATVPDHVRQAIGQSARSHNRRSRSASPRRGRSQGSQRYNWTPPHQPRQRSRHGRKADHHDSDIDSRASSPHSHASDPPTPPPADLIRCAPAEIQEYIFHLQDVHQEGRAELKSTKRALANTYSSETGRQKRVTRRKEMPVEEPIPYEVEEKTVGEIKKGAKHLATMYIAWFIDENGKQTLRTRIDPRYKHRMRYDSIKTQCQGQLADILSAMPERAHELIKEKGRVPAWALSIILKAMMDQRATMSHRVRQEAGPAIFTDCSSMDLETSNTRSAREDLQRLAGLTLKCNDPNYDAFNIEMLHTDYEGVFDVDKVFLNPTLMRVACSLIFGKKSVNNFRLGVALKPAAETNSSLWGLCKVTPGLIALSAILARWAVSADNQFREVGRESFIDWRGDFHLYLEYLVKGYAEGREPVVNCLRIWNNQLFPAYQESKKHRKESAADNDADAGPAASALHALEQSNIVADPFDSDDDEAYRDDVDEDAANDSDADIDAAFDDLLPENEDQGEDCDSEGSVSE